MKIYFATHSTSEDNEAGISSGWKDVRLSLLGTQQARELGIKFEDIDLDLICCSDLVRAVDTVRIAFGDNKNINIDKRLREINYGDLNGKPTEMVDPTNEKWIKKPFPNGESYEQATARIHDFCRELKKTLMSIAWIFQPIVIIPDLRTAFVPSVKRNNSLSAFRWQL